MSKRCQRSVTMSLGKTRDALNLRRVPLPPGIAMNGQDRTGQNKKRAQSCVQKNDYATMVLAGAKPYSS